MAQNQINLLNQSCWNCSISLPQETTPVPSISEYLTKDSVIILSILCAVASVTGNLGNSIVLLAVRNNENLRTIPDLFITSLAFSDLSVCAVYLPMTIFYFVHSVSNAGRGDNEILNLARSFLGHTSLVASATNMFAVTVDRVISIRFPFQYVAVMTTKRALVGILVVWIISLTFGIVYAKMLVSSAYIALYSAILLITTIFLYIHIFIIAKRQENRIQNTQQGSDGAMMEKKVAKTIFTVVGVYALFWLPMLLLPAVANPSTMPAQFGQGFHWTQTLLACNSAVNPYIYCMRSKKYRTAFGKILKIERCFDNQYLP